MFGGTFPAISAAGPSRPVSGSRTERSHDRDSFGFEGGALKEGLREEDAQPIASK